MTFRSRLSLATAAAVAIAVVLASGSAFVALRHALLRSLDETVRGQVDAVANLARQGELAEGAEGRAELARFGGITQIVAAAEPASSLGGGAPQIPVSPAARRVAAGRQREFFATVTVAGERLRVLTVALQPGSALQVARPLAEVDRDLRRLAFILVFVAAGGVALAVVLGWIVTRAALTPLHRLTRTVETVGETGDLSRRVEFGGGDELGRLAASFNRLLEALEESQRTQEQLVVDASHELRTPLTSLRTNLEVLRRIDELSPVEREQLLGDLLAQMDELTALVRDMVELARGEGRGAEAETVALDSLVAAVVERSQGHARTRGVTIISTLAPSFVLAGRARLERAVANLIDNAVQWSESGGTVEVASGNGAVVVRDHGPGISPDDLPFVFDRFYRAPAARSRPGSGLGLAIVRQVAQSDGGSVAAANHPGGGTVVELRLPTCAGSP